MLCIHSCCDFLVLNYQEGGKMKFDELSNDLRKGRINFKREITLSCKDEGLVEGQRLIEYIVSRGCVMTKTE